MGVFPQEGRNPVDPDGVVLDDYFLIAHTVYTDGAQGRLHLLCGSGKGERCFRHDPGGVFAQVSDHSSKFHIVTWLGLS